MKPLEKNSTFKNILKIIAANSIQGLSKKTLTPLFGLLEYHTKFECLFLALENVINIYEPLQEMIQDSKWRDAGNKILATEETGLKLFDNRKVLIKHLPKLGINLKSRARNIRQSSLSKVTTDSPLWGTLGHQPEQVSAFKPFFILLAQVWLCRTALADHPNKKLLNDSFHPALAAIHTLAIEADSAELKLLPTQPASPEEYLKQLSRLPKDLQVHRITDFITDTIDYISHKTREPEEDPEPKIGGTLPSFVLAPPTTTLTPSDDDIEPHLPILPAKRSTQNILKSWTGRQIRKKLAQENQLFPFSYDALSDAALKDLIRYFDLPNEGALFIDDLETKSLLALTFWAAMNEERLSNLTVSRDPLLGENDTDCLHYATGTLRLESKHPDIKYMPSKEAESQLLPRQTHIDLALPKQAVACLQAYIDLSDRTPTEKLFARSPSDITTLLKEQLRDLKQESGSHMTLAQIQSYLPDRLARTGTGDSASSILTFGNESYLGRTKVFYTAFDHHDLTISYQQLCHGILTKTGATSNFKPEYPLGNTRHVGTPKRPRLQTVRRTFETLVQMIHPNSPAEDIDEFIRRHNYYVAFTALLISYSIGFRAVRHPYIDSQSYDPDSGFCGISDKNSSAGNRARPVWLPKVCQQHLEQYRRYLDTLVTTKTVTGAPHRAIEDQGLASLFFLKKTKKRLSASIVRPKTLNEHIQCIEHFIPLNSQRHLLKSELQEDGCPPDVIELFLGHWEIGEEGYSPSSALHPWDYKRTLETYLFPLLDRIGLRPLAGPTLHKPGFKVRTSMLPKDTSARRKKNRSKKHDLSTSDRQQLQALLADTLPEEHFESLSREQLDVLIKATKKLPELFHTDQRNLLTAEDIRKFYFRLGAQRLDTRIIYKQQMFFSRLMNDLFNQQDNPIELPPPPKFIPPEKNLVRDKTGRNLVEFQRLEQAFVRDLEHPIQTKKNLRVGQIFLSGILYGGLLARKWALALPHGLQNGIFQTGDSLWIDLWRPNGPPSDDFDRFLAQMEPERYRRWLPDPTTRLIIYRWLDQYSDEHKTCGELDLESTLVSYLRHLGFHFGTGKSVLNKLLQIAGAVAVKSLPPVMVAYAKGLTPSASLPDERWLKILTGQTIPIPQQKQPNELSTFSEEDFLLSSQKKLRKKLCQIILPADGNKHLPPATTAKNIGSFLKDNQGKLSPTVQLLADWAIFLLHRRDQEDTPHKKKTALGNRTVANYISKIGDTLIESFRWQNPTHMDVEEQQDIYAEMGNRLRKRSRTQRVKNTTTEFDQKRLRTIFTLNLFHWYLEICHNIPYDAIADLIKSAKGRIRQRVSAQIILPTEFRELLRSFNFDSPDRSRLDSIACCLLILAYRAGLRRAEILGLRFKDVISQNPLEMRIVPHKERRTKSNSAKRNIPSYLPIPEDEVDFLRTWLHTRQSEPKVKLNSYLFTSSEFDKKMLADNELMPTIIDRIKQITGDSRTIFHHGRHSFYGNLTLPVMLREDIPLKEEPPFIAQTTEIPLEFMQAVMGNNGTGRVKLHAVAMLAGHADVATGMMSYFHLCDWLLSYYTRHPFAAPKLTAQSIASLLNLSISQAYNIQRNQGFPYPDSLLNRAQKHRNALTHPSSRIEAIAKSKQTPIPAPKTPLPIFEVAFEKLKQSHATSKNKWTLPKTSQQLNGLAGRYNSIRSKHGATQDKLIRIAQELNPHITKHHVECASYQTARDLIWFLSEAGITLDERCAKYSESRWKDKTNRDGFIRWKGKFPDILISISPTLTRSKQGGLRISISQEAISLLKMFIQL